MTSAAPEDAEPVPDDRRRRGVATAAAAALAVAALVAVLVVAGLALHRSGGRTVDLGDATLAMLDTVAVDGRRVTASFGGVVRAVGPDGTLWVGTDDHAFAVRGAEADSLRVDDRVLVVGRVRADGHGRWLDARALTRVVSEALGSPRRSGERPTVQPDE